AADLRAHDGVAGAEQDLGAAAHLVGLAAGAEQRVDDQFGGEGRGGVGVEGTDAAAGAPSPRRGTLIAPGAATNHGAGPGRAAAPRAGGGGRGPSWINSGGSSARRGGAPPASHSLPPRRTIGASVAGSSCDKKKAGRRRRCNAAAYVRQRHIGSQPRRGPAST